MQILAALTHEPHADFRIEPVEMDAPQADEVVVRIVAAGLCHTDIAVRDGVIPVPQTPCILGHEGAGVVAAVGSAVRKVAVGDHVALSFASCGACPSCQRGMPGYCDQFLALNFFGRRPDGSCTHHQDGKEVNGCFFGQSSFATHALAKERNVVKVPRDVPIELLGPLGCGVQTGAGTVLNHLKAEAGRSIAVFGVGAVGLSAIMAARLAGCATIVAVDMHPSRLALARELGATHAIHAGEGDVPATIRELTGGGADYVVEATGLAGVVASSIRSARRLGHVALLGAGAMDAPLPLVMGDLMAGAVIRYVVEGDSVPETFIPELIGYYRQGRFPFDRLVRFYDLSAINDAVRDCETGSTIKAVIRMPHTAI